MNLKKFIAFALVLVMILTVTNMQVKAAHGEASENTTKTSETGNKVVDSFAEKYYSTISLETDFTNNEIIVVISRHYGEINKEHSVSDMATVVKDGYLQQKDGRYELNKAAQAFQGLDFITQIDNEVAENIVKIEDLSRIDGDIDALGINRDTYKQILKLTLKSNSKENVLNIMHQLEKNPYIESADPNLIFKDESTVELKRRPNDPSYGDIDKSWGLREIKAPEAWDETTGSRQVKVGVIDRGIYEHCDLEANVSRSMGWNFADQNDDTDGVNDHGTHVAGIIGAIGNNQLGMTGTCWRVGIVPLKIWNNTSNNWVVGRVASAVSYATDNNIPILNMSAGHPNEHNGEKTAIENYPGLFVTSAGNTGWDTDIMPTNSHYPSCYKLDNMITVCATDETDNLWVEKTAEGEPITGRTSNWGKTTVHIAAPGANIYSTVDSNRYGYKSGTSMAAPFVAGTAALIKTKYPGITTTQLRNAILNTARKPLNNQDKLEGKCVTEGILNAQAALIYASTHNSGGYLHEGVYYIKNVRSGKYLSVRTPTATVYSQSVQNNFTGGNEQKWRLENHYNYRVLIPLCNT
ncbi:MAG: S8 family serine peptidase, partial [Clostridiales bacterium]|nr:S8 family serine peptidase [Clostridiales bacterium]